MNGKDFHDLVAGKKKNVGSTLLLWGLAGLELPYSAVVALRNRLYDFGILKSTLVSVPTLSVGNITLGGTGKSPLVTWLGRFFLEHGVQPGIISRGYGSAKHVSGRHTILANDEYLELAFRLPEVPHVQNPDRVAASRELLEFGRFQRPIDLIILDDAMQHRRIQRDLNIVLLDATEPFGWEHVFPRGTLREPLSGLRRADVVFLSRADLVSEPARKEIKERVLRIAPEILWGEIAHVPDGLVAWNRDEQALSVLRDSKVLAFCGIGNPSAFQQTLEACGAEVAELIVFPDHHHYSDADWNRLEKAVGTHSPDFVLCTMKDMVKLDRQKLGEKEILAVSIQIRFLEGENEFRERLVGLIRQNDETERSSE